MKTATHNDITITFNPDNHSYTDNQGRTYTSVTTFIGYFFPKFDENTMAIKCAAGNNKKYKGRDPKDIKAEWQAKGDRGRNEGHNIHEIAEWYLLPFEPNIDLKPDAISPRVEKLEVQTKIAINKLVDRFHLIGTEIIVFSPKLLLAGQIDLLMLDNDTGNLIILDWKQNATISMDNPGYPALPPIEHLDECDYSKYALQLNLYEQIMQAEHYYHPYEQTCRKSLIHLQEDKYNIIKVGDFKKEIEDMLDFGSEI